MEPSLLSALQSAAADTLVALQSRDPLAKATDIAILVAATSLAFLSLYVVWTMARFRRTLDALRRAIHQNLGPASDRARSIAENVQFITQAVRTDVERLNASVKALTARLHQASDHMEERIEEFNALMEVVQDEAEDIFLDTAATVRGVREGARSLGRKSSTPSGVPVSRNEADPAGDAAYAEEPDESRPTPADEAVAPGDR